MSLNKQEIEKAVYAEKNTGEFAQLMQEFKKIGVKRYDYLVAEQSNHEAIKEAVKRAQSGVFDFETFCELAGKAGVYL